MLDVQHLDGHLMDVPYSLSNFRLAANSVLPCGRRRLSVSFAFAFFFFNFQSQQCYKKRLAVRHKLLLLRYGLAFQSADPEKMEVFDGIGWMKQPM